VKAIEVRGVARMTANIMFVIVMPDIAESDSG
jgi:hypothetical protein